MTEKLTEISKELNHQSDFDHLPALIFMTDQDAQPMPENIIAKMPKGAMVIFRDYQHQNRTDLGKALCYICKARGVKFIVAGDLTLCLMLGADGIHLPEYMVGETKNIRADHKDLLITTAAHGEQAVSRAQSCGVDAILLAPIFPTKSHMRTIGNPKSCLGRDKLKYICGKYKIAIYALGGITQINAAELMDTGITGIATIRGLEA